MSYSLPTLADLLDRARKAFRTTLPGTDAFLWPNNIGPTAKVIAGSVFEVFGFAAYIAKMIFVASAPDLETLLKHGNEYGIPLRPAYPASGKVTFTAAASLTVAVGAVVQRSDGVQYVMSEAGAILVSGTIELAATALEPGAASNTPAGTALSFVSGVTGDPTATAAVSADFIEGADVEDVETYRARILFRKRNPPHGGSPADYVLWASSVIGVTRVFVEPRWTGPGTVRVFPLMDALYLNGIAPPDAIARVSDYILSVAPAGAAVTVSAPAAVPVNVVISGLAPNTLEVQEAITASLREAFSRLSAVAGVATPHAAMPYLASPQSFSVSWIWQAVANATGEQRHTITAPAVDVALIAGQIATLGTVTFV